MEPYDSKHIEILLDQYRSQQDLHKSYADCLRALISGLLADHNLKVHDVAARAKCIKSLHDKIWLKKYQSLSEITDLTGARIILYFKNDIDKTLKILRDEFEIDFANSEDKRERPNPYEFGYRSFHYIVTMKSERTSLPEYKRFAGLKAEIQVRTILDHAWAEIQHGGLGYKAEGAVPRKTQRDLAKAAALLEVADEHFVEARRTAAKAARALPIIRSEGLSELIPEFSIAVPTAVLAEARRGFDSLKFLFSTNVTSTREDDRYLRSVRLIAPTSAGPVRGVLAAENGVVFLNSMPQHVASNQRAVQFTVKGLRIDAASIGAGTADSPHLAQCWVVACSRDSQRQSEVLVAQNIAAASHAFEFSARQISGANEHGNGSVAIQPIAVLSFRELLPQALRPSGQESSDPLDPCSSGTRLVVRFQNIPKEAALFADIESVGVPARLTNANSLGMGRFDPIVGTQKHQGRNLAAITTSGGAASMVWEVQESSPGSSSAEINIYAYVATCAPAQVSVSGTLGPTSVINTSAGEKVPVPRFINDPKTAVFSLCK